MRSNELFVNLNEVSIGAEFRFQVFIYNGDGVDVKYYVIKAPNYDAAKLILVSLVPDLDGFFYLTEDYSD